MIQNNEPKLSARDYETSNSQPPILIAENLHKSYGNHQALRGLSFSLQAGRILGFLGPNGAGKTTAIRILTTILEATSGHFTVANTSSKYPEEIRRKIGVLPESLGFPKQISAIEYLAYFGQHYGRTSAEAKANGLGLLEEVGLAHRANSLIGTYSRGMRQRLGIARALVNDPVVVFLDEPTLGLDPRGKQELLELVQRVAQERRAGVVFCSHLLTEVEELCDDVIILKAGQVVSTGTVGQVIEKAQQNIIRIRVPGPSIEEARQRLAAAPSVMDVRLTGKTKDWLEVQLVDPSDGHTARKEHITINILNTLLNANIPVINFDAEGGRLQDIFFQLTEDKIA